MTPSPFPFPPLPPSPPHPPSSAMATVPEETETQSTTTSDHSIPKTEVEVLPFKESPSLLSPDKPVPPPVPKKDYLVPQAPGVYDIPTVSSTGTLHRSKEKKTRPKYDCPPEDLHVKKKKEKKEKKEDRPREKEEGRKERKERKEKREGRGGGGGGHGRGHGRGKSKSMEEQEGRSRQRHSSRSVERPSSHSPHPSHRNNGVRHRSHSPHRSIRRGGHCVPEDQDDATSLQEQGSNCDCPAHVHDRESPLEIAEVRDAVRVSRTLKNSSTELSRFNF